MVYQPYTRPYILYIMKKVGKQMTETEIQSLILLEASKEGHRLWRSNAGTAKTKNGFIKLFPKGFPDTIGFRRNDGKFIAIEVKTPKGKMSENQKKFAKFTHGKPIIYGVARSPEEAIDIIEDGGMSDERWIELHEKEGVELPFGANELRS